MTPAIGDTPSHGSEFLERAFAIVRNPAAFDNPAAELERCARKGLADERACYLMLREGLALAMLTADEAEQTAPENPTRQTSGDIS